MWCVSTTIIIIIIADAIAKKESRQVNEKFFELKKEDVGMVTKVKGQD